VEGGEEVGSRQKSKLPVLSKCNSFYCIKMHTRNEMKIESNCRVFNKSAKNNISSQK
jgi:hypothetical protein